MLPTPQKLREQSRQLREAARKTTDDTVKCRLAKDALVLAQLAEAIECDKIEEGAKAKRYARPVAEVLGEDAVRARDAAQEINTHMRSQIRTWRMRADELRTTANQFEVPSAQDSLRSAARNYDLMADNLENLMGCRRPVKDENAG